MKNNVFIPVLLGLSLISTGVVGSEQWFETSQQTVVQQRIFNGEIEAVNRATVSAQTSGRVKVFHFDVNDYVQKGQTILEITNKEQLAALKRAKANQESTQVAFDQSKVDYDRAKSVYEKKLIAKSQLDSALAKMNGLKAQLKAAKAAVVQTQEQYDYTLIKAPYDGIVTKRLLEQGEAVRPGTPIIEGISLNQLRVTTNIPETIINRVRQKLAVSVFSRGQSLSVNKTTIFPFADKATRTFKVRIDLNENQTELFPGMTVKVAFETGQKPAILIPNSAVIHRGEQALVYVKQQDNSQVRQVKLGDFYEDKVEVISGLSPKELVRINH